MAEAKLHDAETLEDLQGWLKRNEKMALLHDRALIELAMRLPRVASLQPATAAAE